MELGLTLLGPHDAQLPSPGIISMGYQYGAVSVSVSVALASLRGACAFVRQSSIRTHPIARPCACPRTRRPGTSISRIGSMLATPHSEGTLLYVLVRCVDIRTHLEVPIAVEREPLLPGQAPEERRVSGYERGGGGHTRVE